MDVYIHRDIETYIYIYVLYVPITDHGVEKFFSTSSYPFMIGNPFPTVLSSQNLKHSFAYDDNTIWKSLDFRVKWWG